MLADPRGIYSVAEDVNTGSMALDTSVGYAPYGLTQSLRYDFADQTSNVGTSNTGRCGDYTIGRNLSLPSHQTEIWTEVVMKTVPTWVTLAPAGWGCISAAAYKFWFGRTDVSRYQVVVGIFGETADYTFGYPGNEEPADWAMPWTPFDGNWHVYRTHWKDGSGGGVCTLMIDGTVIRTFTGITTSNSYIYGLALGRNINQGPPANQSIYWGCISAWFAGNDPGWGI